MGPGNVPETTLEPKPEPKATPPPVIVQKHKARSEANSLLSISAVPPKVETSNVIPPSVAVPDKAKNGKSESYGPTRKRRRRTKKAKPDLPYDPIDSLGRWKPMALGKMSGKAKY